MADPIPTNAKRRSVSGTSITGGIIIGEEYSRRLIGRYGLDQFDIMRRSNSSVRGALQVVKLPILAGKYDVKPAETAANQDEAEFRARFIKRELMQRNIDFVKFMKDTLTALDFGFSVHEKEYELTTFEGRTLIGIAGLWYVKQTTIMQWETENTKKPGIHQFCDSGKYDVEMPKLFVYSHDKEGDNYDGTSLLRYVFKDWDMVDKLTIVNAISLEKLGSGVAIAKETGGTVSPSAWQAVEEILRNIRTNEDSYIKQPSGIEIEMLDMKGSTTKEILPTIQYHERRIFTTILAQFMELGGSSGSGSQSLSSDLTSLFFKSEGALAYSILSEVMRQIVKQICDLNFTDNSDGYPVVTVSNLSDDDVQAISTAVGTLMNAGALTADPEVEDHLRAMLDMPKLTQDQRDNYDELHQPPQPVDPNTDPKAKPKVDPKKKPAKTTDKTKAALNAARDSRMRLIDALYN